MKIAIACLIVLVAGACSSTNVMETDRCKLRDFERSAWDHIIEVIPSPFVVRRVQGNVRVRTAPQPGGWPAGFTPRLELRGPRGPAGFLEVDAQGRFAGESLPAGAYCFKLSAEGFRSVLGNVIVDPRAPRDAAMEIVLIWAE